LRSLYISGFFAYAAVSTVFPVISPYASLLGASEFQSAIIAGAYAIVTAIAMMPFGHLSDKYGRAKFMILGLVLYISSPLLYIFVKDITSLLLARILHGFGMALYVPALNALVADKSPENRRGEAMGWISAAFMFGFVLGPVTGGLLAEKFGVISTFLSSSAFSVLSFLSICPYLNLKKTEFKKMKEEDKLVASKNILAASLATFFTTFGSAAVAIFALPFYSNELNITSTLVGTLTSSLFFVSALARIPAGKLSDKIGRSPVIVLGLLVEGIGIYFMVFREPLQLLFATWLCGIGMGFTNTASYALASDVRRRGMAIGAVNSSLNAGIFVGPAVAGLFAEYFGFEVIFTFSAVFVLASSIVVTVLLKNSD